MTVGYDGGDASDLRWPSPWRGEILARASDVAASRDSSWTVTDWSRAKRLSLLPATRRPTSRRGSLDRSATVESGARYLRSRSNPVEARPDQPHNGVSPPIEEGDGHGKTGSLQFGSESAESRSRGGDCRQVRCPVVRRSCGVAARGRETRGPLDRGPLQPHRRRGDRVGGHRTRGSQGEDGGASRRP